MSKLTDKIRDIADDHRAVSPAVGVALLVAITVILAAVIGFVVLDTNTDSSNAKNARLSIDSTSATEATISHEGGDSFNPDNIVVKANGTATGTTLNVGSDGKFNTGDSTTVSGLGSGSTELVVIWEDPESDREVQLGEATVE